MGSDDVNDDVSHAYTSKPSIPVQRGLPLLAFPLGLHMHCPEPSMPTSPPWTSAPPGTVVTIAQLGFGKFGRQSGCRSVWVTHEELVTL